MARQIRKVVVLGANGAMGAGSGEVFAAAGIETIFLARTRDKAPRGSGAPRSWPSRRRSARYIRTGSYDEDLARGRRRGRPDLRGGRRGSGAQAAFFEKIDRLRQPDSIVATVSSGLSIAGMATRAAPSFARHFLGIHFFNPPNVIVGCELIPHAGTDPRVVADVTELLQRAARPRAGAHQRHAGVSAATASASRCSTSARSSPRSTAPPHRRARRAAHRPRDDAARDHRLRRLGRPPRDRRQRLRQHRATRRTRRSRCRRT